MSDEADFVISFAEWRQEQKKNFQKAIAAFAAEGTETFGDDALFYPFFAQVVKSWPFEGDPGDVDSYDELSIAEFEEVKEKVFTTFRKFIERTREGNVSRAEIRKQRSRS